MTGKPMKDRDAAESLARFRFGTRIKVRFSETDANRHVNQASFFIYMEQARMDYFDRLGLTLVVHDPFNRCTLIAADLACQYKAPLFYGQAIDTKARVARMGRSSLEMEYALVEESSGKLAATGRGTLVYFDHQAGTSAPLPAEVRQAIAAFEGLPG